MAALLTPALVFVDANARTTCATPAAVAGTCWAGSCSRCSLTIPLDPAATGARTLEASLRRVVASGERDAMALQRYDVQSRELPGEWEERYWSPVNAPVLDADGRVVLLVHRVEEVTELIRARSRNAGDRALVLEAELYTQGAGAAGSQRAAAAGHAREREVALALQAAMLPALRPVGQHRAAVRATARLSAR
ncbi:hypothetical protein ACU686_09750 [Yinghuangia aomiensis]